MAARRAYRCFGYAPRRVVELAAAILLFMLCFGLPGRATAGPAIVVDPLHLEIVPANIGFSSSGNVTITNTGDADLAITDIAVNNNNGVNFTIGTNNCQPSSVAPGGSCNFEVVFNPQAPKGGKSCTIAITSNAAPPTSTLSVAATALTMLQIYVDGSPLQLNFPDTLVGATSSSKLVTLHYNYNENRCVQVTPAGPDFIISNDQCNGACFWSGNLEDECTFEVSFSPSGEGAHADAILIYTELNTNPDDLTIALTGRGVAPKVELSTDHLDFKNQLINTCSPPLAVEVMNTGTGDLTDIDITSSNPVEFRIFKDGCSGTTVPSGNSCELKVSFCPIKIDQSDGVISIMSNAASSPDTVSVSGNGLSPQAVPTISQWGLLLLGLLLLGSALAVLKRKRV